MTSSDRDMENSQPQPATESTTTAPNSHTVVPVNTVPRCPIIMYTASPSERRPKIIASITRLESRKLMMTPASTSPVTVTRPRTRASA